MNETEKELWKSLDKTVLGTDDPKVIKETLKREFAELQRLESSFGGSLSLFRNRRGLRVEEISKEAKVSPDQWRAWEADLEIPSLDELNELAKKLHLSDFTMRKIRKVWQQAPFRALQRLSEFRPKLRAARGVAATNSEVEWEALPEVVQAKLAEWGRKNSFSFPNELFDVLESLESEDSQQTWAQEVWGDE